MQPLKNFVLSSTNPDSVSWKRESLIVKPFHLFTINSNSYGSVLSKEGFNCRLAHGPCLYLQKRQKIKL